MAVTSEEPTGESPTDASPLLMEHTENCESNEHVINIEQSGDPSSSDSSDSESPRGLSSSRQDDRPSARNSQSSSSNGSNSQSPSVTRRGEGFGRHWSPFNTVLWISIELVFTLGQIIAAVVVLSVSRHENPQTPLFAWVLGYALGCAASLPLLYWRYLHCNQAAERRSAQFRQGSRRVNSSSDPNSYITFSLTRSSEDEGGRNTSADNWNAQNNEARNARIVAFVDHFKMALDCFFAVWFVVGNVWIFGGHSSASDAPNLYRLCIVFLTFSCIGYAMPFILCAMICCCLPCIISFLGVREDMNGMRGATEESINALPTHKFKLMRTVSEISEESGSEVEGGVLAAGTDKERAISGEDAVCCICLSNYEDNDEVRELPCSHFFHTACVDKWLKLNASCPLCKLEIGAEIGAENEHSPLAAEASQQV
nr:E3 ubiquitin-protein ligase At1g63170-like [Ipomoea batatas]